MKKKGVFESAYHFSEREDMTVNLGVGPGGPGPPFSGLLNISALHVQYRIQTFAKFKRPKCTITLGWQEVKSRQYKTALSVSIRLS